MNKNSITTSAVGLCFIALTLAVPVSGFAVEPEHQATDSGRFNKVEQRIDKVQTRFEDKKTDLQNRIEKNVATREAKLATRSAQISQREQERKSKIVSNLFRRFEAVTKRQENILKRINTRLDKLEANKNTDVSSLRRQSSASAILLQNQKSLVQNFKQQLSQSTNSGTGFDSIKASAEKIITQIRTTHKSLVNLVVAVAKSQSKQILSPKTNSTPNPLETTTENR